MEKETLYQDLIETGDYEGIIELSSSKIQPEDLYMRAFAFYKLNKIDRSKVTSLQTIIWIGGKSNS